MQKKKQKFSLRGYSVADIKRRMLYWANAHNILLFLDNNFYESTYSRFECLVGVGTDDGTLFSLAETDNGISEPSWLLGHIAYDYKNAIFPGLERKHTSCFSWDNTSFFVPGILCYIPFQEEELFIECGKAVHPETIWKSILETELPGAGDSISAQEIQFVARQSKADYMQTIAMLKQHIYEGDFYEINYCVDNYCEQALINPVLCFDRLNQASPSPFAAFYKCREHYVIGASPERFIQKNKTQIIAQPIKGTAKRSENPAEDERLKDRLKESIKDKAENVMIVDLMRNDLARVCKTGTVEVRELFGVYSYPRVHQMISTVSGTLKDAVNIGEIIDCTFPMGSMTGAPKYIVMQHIERYEKTARGLFSGSLGYISPDKDFDFNVNIRSLFYNAATHYLSYASGGAITYDSIAEEEWEEARLKAAAMERLFTAQQ